MAKVSKNNKKNGKKVVNGLMALSSAAVLAVYSAGYAKTDSAAQRLAAQTAQRHASMPTTAPLGSPVSASSVTAPAAAISTPSAAEPQQIATINPLHSASPLPDGAPAVATPSPAAKTPVPQTNTPAPAASGTVSVAAPGNSAPPAAAPAPTVDMFGFAPVAQAPVAPTPPDVKWRTGTFYGWGTSQHGDIQAAVVIINGRIDNTFIAQCLTKYACDIINKLPGMAVSRQSSNLDNVSGATESTFAFTSAVEDALTQAKNPLYRAPTTQTK